MNQLKFIMAILGCIILTACSEEYQAKKAVSSFIELQNSQSVPKVDIKVTKFKKFTKFDDSGACFTVVLGNRPVEFQIILEKDISKNKWKASGYFEGNYEDYLKEKKEKAEKQFYEDELKKAVLRSLKDPDSAKFGTIRDLHDKKACITVNARNAYGGYTGDQQAILIKTGNKWDVLGIHDISSNDCFDVIISIPTR